MFDSCGANYRSSICNNYDSDVIARKWRLKSPASRLFAPPFVQAQIKQNIRAPRHWPVTWKMFSFHDVIMTIKLMICYNMLPLPAYAKLAFMLKSPWIVDLADNDNNLKTFNKLVLSTKIYESMCWPSSLKNLWISIGSISIVLLAFLLCGMLGINTRHERCMLCPAQDITLWRKMIQARNIIGQRYFPSQITSP